MTNEERTPGRFGRKPPKHHPALRLSDVLTGVLPEHPIAADYLERLGGWQMLGNDRHGDCVSVTWSNTRRLVTATLATENYPNLDQVIEFYKTQNPNFPTQDTGMDIQTALEYLVKQGGPDGVRAVAFAQVDYTNPDEVKAAIAIFGSVWIGINVLQSNMTEFNAGEPWDYSDSPVDGGHSVLTGGYGAPGVGALGGDERFITWAQETSFTDNFWSHAVEEAWVVIWPEHLGTTAFLEGVSLAQLAADYQSLTGQPFPIPPTPTPEPTPPPTPTPPTSMEQADKALTKAFRAWEHTRTYHTEEHPMRHSVDI